MSNIHGFHNLGPRAAPAAPPASRYQRQPDATAMPVWTNSDAHAHQSFARMGWMESEGVSMMAPPMRPDGLQPTLSERIFPGIRWKSATTFVVLLNLVLFIIELIVGGAKYDGAFVSGNSMGGPSALTMCNMGGKWTPSIRAGGVWRLLTAIVLHAGVLHLASNTFFQMRFGYITETRWGTLRWVVLYILTGIMASLWSSVLNPRSVSVGASGALFGILGADLAYLAYNWSHIPHNRQEAIIVVIIAGINLLLGMGSGIDNYAHLGGLVGGLFLGVAIPPHLELRPMETLFRAVAWFIFAGLALLFMLLLWVGNPWPEYYGPSGCWA